MFGAAVWLRLRAWEPPVPRTQTPAEVGAVAAAAGGNVADAPEQTEATMTVVEADGTSATVINGTAARNSRQQRYEELLRSAPPPGPPPKERSILDRVMTPIANLFGGGRERPESAPAAASRGAQTVARGSSQPGDSATAASTTTEQEQTTTTAPEVDEETDVVPPQLLHAEFVPSEVRDGEETVLVAMASDNLSGVRSISGVVTSPSGSNNGFSCTKDPTTDRYLGSVKVPKEAPEGIWTVKYLTLTDNASNNVILRWGQALPPTASFRVISSAPDASGPQLTAIWLDRPSMLAGDKNTLFVQAEDNQVGISHVSGVFVSPAKQARLGFSCKAAAEGTWECPLSPPGCLDCGLWTLDQVQLKDKAQNLTTFRRDNPVIVNVALDIMSDSCDDAPPLIASIGLDPLVVSNAQASNITVTVMLNDQGTCGVSSISGQAIPRGGIGGQRRQISFKAQPDGQTFIGTLEIPQYAAKGEWIINWIQTVDKGHNMRVYGASDPVVSRAVFRVE